MITATISTLFSQKEEEKKSVEITKIRNLDKKFAQATKLQRDIKMALIEKEAKLKD